MSVYVKVGDLGSGHWREITDGSIRVKPYLNPNWVEPGYVYVKEGGLGGGYWRNTGYRGRPRPPQSLRMTGWSFSAANVGWDAPAGGGPVASYEVEMRDSGGVTVLESQTGLTGLSSNNFTVGEDWLVAFFVRAKGPTGLYSDWAQGWYLNPDAGDYRMSSRARIGHSEQGHYANEGRIREWHSGQASGARRKDNAFAVYAPDSNFVIQSLHWRNLRTRQGNIIAPQWNEWGSMTIYWAINGVRQNPITDNFGQIWSGDNRDWWISNGITNISSTSWYGLVPDGSGWSTWDDPEHMLYCDAVWVQGYENYSVSVYYKTRDFEGNNYW